MDENHQKYVKYWYVVYSQLILAIHQVYEGLKIDSK